MNLRRVKHTMLRLSPEEKGVGIGGLLVIFGSFMPWYRVNDIIREKVSTSYGFSNDVGIIGIVVFLIVILSLIVLIADHLHFYLPKFGYKKEQIILFLMGESAFLNLILIAIYTKRSLIPMHASLGFGIYIALAGSLIGVLSAFAQSQKIKKSENRTLPDYSNDERPTDHQEEYDSQSATTNNQIEEEIIFEDDMIEEIEVPETIVKESAPTQNISTNQGNYFMKEAGMGQKSGAESEESRIESEEVEPESPESVVENLEPDKKNEDEEKTKKNSLGGFYED